MLIERQAYGNRWRKVDPAAKTVFAGCVFVAALISSRPALLFAMASLVAAITVFGAGIRPRDYLRAFLPPFFFLVASLPARVLSIDPGVATHSFTIALDKGQISRIPVICGRSSTCLSALLFLGLTTPMVSLIGLLRRVRTPAALLDLMTLGYRMFFVLLETATDIRIAQEARLGWASNRLALRSLGLLAANLAFQVWRRGQALHVAAMARANDGPLVFLDDEGEGGTFPLVVALAAGLPLLVSALVFK